jgi:hypothetical protein
LTLAQRSRDNVKELKELLSNLEAQVPSEEDTAKVQDVVGEGKGVWKSDIQRH